MKQPLALNRHLLPVMCAALPWVDYLPLSTWLLFVMGSLLLAGRIAGQSFRAGKPDFLLLLFLAFYGLQLLGFAFRSEAAQNLFSLEQKAALLFVPLLLSGYLRQFPESWITGVRGFIAGNLAAGSYCLAVAIARYLSTGHSGVFFYHAYSGAIGANAIYLSLHAALALGLALLYFRNGRLRLPVYLMVLITAFLFGNILLLSSRMIIAFSVLFLVWYLRTALRSRAVRITTLTMTGLGLAALLFTSNPVVQRYEQLRLTSAKEILTRTDFTNYPFNGMEIRLLLWRMGAELLSAREAWLQGAGGRAYHQALNEKMKAYHLFEGNDATGDTGYLNYNMHNQYAENLVQYGVAGLALLLLLLGAAFRTGLTRGNAPLVYGICLFSIAFLTESVLETQQGILLFTTFIYGEWKRSKLAM